MKMVLFVLLLCLVGLGFWRGWLALSSHGGDGESNKVDINLTVDPDKAKADVEKAKDKTTELGDQARDTVKQDNR
jgi:hypothetical protein